MANRRDVILAFGSNASGAWGEPGATIRRAIHELSQRGVRLVRLSQLAVTRPLGALPQPDYVNGAGVGETGLDAETLLALVKQLEAEAGRQPGPRWGPRPLDIDIIDFGGDVRGWDAPHDPMRPAHLVLPHPEMHRRRFVLEPVAEIAPGWRHPVLGKTAGELLKTVD